MNSNTEANRELVLHLWEQLENTNDVAAVVARCFHDDYVRKSATGQLDRSSWIETVQVLYSAFPDLQTEITVTIAEDDWIAYKWSSAGHHTGTYYGIPPTGKTVHAEGITLNRFQDGLIVEEHSSWNKVDVMHTLGIIPISVLK
jgi:steroid delta-isomerase-like uncharacterized protein